MKLTNKANMNFSSLNHWRKFAAGLVVVLSFFAFKGQAQNAPSNLMAYPQSSTSILLNWTDNSNNETGFGIERGTTPSNLTLVGSVGANIVEYVDTGLTPATQYYYRVYAIGTPPAKSGYSNTVSAKTYSANLLPATPSNLNGTAINSSTIQIDWKDNATSEDSFRVERSVNGGPFLYRAGIKANQTSFTDSNLLAEQNYCYRVFAMNITGYSDYSNTKCIRTLARPSNVTATGTSANTIRLIWTDNSLFETGYTIERSLDSLNFVTVTTVVAPSYLDQGLNPTTTYYYRVFAINKDGRSNSTGAVGNTTAGPNKSSNLFAAPKSSTQIILTWTDNSSDETGFRIERSTSANGSYTLLITTQPNTANYLDIGLQPSTTYYYRVSTQSAAGIASADTASARTYDDNTFPATPTRLAGVPNGISAINLSWVDNANNENGFSLERSNTSKNGPYTPIATNIPANTTTYTDNAAVTANVKYYYRIRAFVTSNPNIFSNYSNIDSVKINSNVSLPNAPSNLIAAATGSFVKLQWKDNSNTETEFRIERSLDNSNWQPAGVVAANTVLGLVQCAGLHVVEEIGGVLGDGVGQFMRGHIVGARKAFAVDHLRAIPERAGPRAALVDERAGMHGREQWRAGVVVTVPAMLGLEVAVGVSGILVCEIDVGIAGGGLSFVAA